MPNGFSEKDELIWTLTVHGKTEKAFATLRPDYIVDDVVKASETGALGAGSGATFALIARATEPSRVGGVTGLVGAAGGLGGFVPPLLMGYVYGRTDSYAIGLWLLSITAALTLVLTLTVVRRTAAERTTA